MKKYFLRPGLVIEDTEPKVDFSGGTVNMARGISDGFDGKPPQFPKNSRYMKAYDAGKAERAGRNSAGTTGR